MIPLPPILKPLSLKKTLKRLGTPKLSSIIGNDRIEIINEVLPTTSVTESKLVSFLLLRHGSQILANKEIRKNLLLQLPAEYQTFILYGENCIQNKLTEDDKIKLLTFSWRKNKPSLRTLAVFDLAEEFLPPKNEILPDVEIIAPELFLYPYQLRLKNRFVRSLVKGDERILIHVPTGAGKTRVCTEGLIDFWRSFADRSGFFVWLAHSEELCEQAAETFKMIWRKRGDTNIEIHNLWGKHKTPDFINNNGYVIASLQRLHSMRTSSSNQIFREIAALKKKCKLIVIDEAHKCIAPTYKASIDFISNIQSTKIIGLTATPGRGLDNQETKELVEFFNANKITITNPNGTEIINPIEYLNVV